VLVAWSIRKIFGGPEPAKMQANRPDARFAVTIPPELLQGMTAGGALAPRISRAEALQVPAVLRARNLICGSLATLPLGVYGPDLRPATDRQYLAPNPDPEIAQVVVMAQTYEDLLFEAVSWWRVTAFGPGGPGRGFPIEAVHVPHDAVTVDPPGGLLPSQQRISPDIAFPVGGQVRIDGRPVPDEEIIRFDSPNPPLLVAGARAIRTLLRLEMSASRYSDDPLPLGYFSPADGADPVDDEDIEEILSDWEAQRQKRAWGYVPAAIKANTVQWSPEQLQLADSRQHAVLEIARLTGLDAEELGVSVTSRTYQNRVERNQDKITYTLGPYVTSVEQRLSMRDVLPRGYETRADYSGFLRADPKSRMETYKTGREVGVWADDDEVRAEERRPRLTPAQRAARQPAPAAAVPPAARTDAPEPQAGQSRREGRVIPMPERAVFNAAETVTMQFEVSTEDFQVDTSRRTITGLLLPWGKVANNGIAKWKFRPNSLDWSDVSRIKLNRHHDNSDLIGVATRLQSANRGLMATFKVGRGPDGDRALEKAEDGILDGFSVEVDFDSADSWEPDPEDSSVRLVHQATLRGVALTGTPAFDDARLTSVKASRDNTKGNAMGTDTKVTTGQPDKPETFDFEGFVVGLADSMKESQSNLVASLTQSIGESVSAGVKVALENISSPQDGPQPVRAARYTVTREAPVYALNGVGPSLVRDGWYAAMHRDDEAMDRLRKFRMQTEDLAKLARSEMGRQAFTTITTANASQVIPPGYRPDLFVPMLAQQRPLVNALSRGVIENATPFVVPVFTSFTGATADHVEGTNPTDGSLALGTKTVTPGAVSGRLVLTREIADSSNPAIDQIALNSMIESYNRQTEGKVYTLLNGANGAGGTITTGFVPSGAQASTYVGSTGTPPALIAGIRGELARYPFNRFNAPTTALMGQNATSILARATDSTGRPIFPSVGAQNASGLGNAVQQGWSVDGLMFQPAWAMTGVAAGDTQIAILNALDFWAWESPLLTFRYEEKSGPALIELALFGYFATHLLRPVGLSGIRIT